VLGATSGLPCPKIREKDLDNLILEIKEEKDRQFWAVLTRYKIDTMVLHNKMQVD
jgi:hypothetical protein